MLFLTILMILLLIAIVNNIFLYYNYNKLNILLQDINNTNTNNNIIF